MRNQCADVANVLGHVIFIRLFNISSSCYSRSIIMTMMVENLHKDITIKRKPNLFVIIIFGFFSPCLPIRQTGEDGERYDD